MSSEANSDLPVANAPSSMANIELGPGLLPAVPQEDQDKLLRIIDDYVRQHRVKRLIDTIARKRSEMDFQSLGILSLNEGDGRTFFTTVLARGLVLYLSARVLVIDSTGKGPGSKLLSVLRSSGRAMDNRHANMGSTGFCTVASLGGTSDTAQSQHEFRCGELVRAVQDEYDIVLVDTQALSVEGVDGFDAGLIAQQLDACVMVVPREPIQPEDLRIYSDRLKALACPCVGFVTNEFGGR